MAAKKVAYQSSKVRQTSCKHCGLDVENFAPYKRGEWRDRGNNTHCLDGRLHVGVLSQNPGAAHGTVDDIPSTWTPCMVRKVGKAVQIKMRGR